MKGIIIIVFIAVTSYTMSSAQSAVEKNPKPKRVYNGPSGHAIGAVVSSTNGKGLAYRYWPENLGFHVSFFPAANGDNKYYNAGVTGYLTIREYEMGNLFLHLGAEYQYSSKQSGYSSGYPTYTNINYMDKTNGLNLGFGPGLHVLQKFISIDFFVGYGAYFRNHSASIDTYTPKDEVIMTLTGGVAFFLEL